MNLRPHPFTLRQLQYVIAVADELSFRRAAERCHVSQPSLSAQLAQLEDVLGVQIFERDQRRVMLTAAGRDIVERATRLLLAADDLVDAGKRASDPLAGTIRMGVIPTVSPYLLPVLAPKLRASFPRLTIAWREEKTDVLLKALDAGEIDAAFLALQSDMADLERELIGTDSFVLALRPDHPLAKSAGPVSTAELRGTQVLLLDDGHCFREQALEVCSNAHVREAEYRATSLGTLVQMVAGGAGVTLLPAISVATEVKRAGLRVRPMGSPGAQRTLALVFRKRTALAETLRSVAAVMRAAYADVSGEAAPTTRAHRKARPRA